MRPRIDVLLLALAAMLVSAIATGEENADKRARAELAPASLAEMDAAITEAIAASKLPGGVLRVERLDAVYSRAYGKRALLPEVETMSEDTIFDAASLTKVLATTPAILLLHERGIIGLDDPVGKYLPAFSANGKEGVTLRHLLTHTSGLRPGLSNVEPNNSFEKTLELACGEKLQTAPGTAFRYSDINFITLGAVAQIASGMKLEEFVAREIYAPLKMADTGYLPPKEKLPRIAPTTKVQDAMLRGTVHDPTARRMGGVAGHAGVFTTAADLSRFARMMLNEGILDGARIFKPETVRLMTSVQATVAVAAPSTGGDARATTEKAATAIRRGLGWDIDSPYSRPRGKHFPIGSYGHTGFTGTSVWIDPASKTFWIFLSNRVHPDGKGNILPLQERLGTLAAEAAGVK